VVPNLYPKIIAIPSLEVKQHHLMPDNTVYRYGAVPSSVADLRHFGVDPDPAFFVIDLQDVKKKK
jgi:hypothetical protein